MVAIELTGNLGLWAQSVLRDRYKYRNFYRWKGRDDRMPDGFAISKSIGFEMNMRTRPLILEMFRGGLQSRQLIPRDPLLLQQMEATEMLAGKWEVPEKVHDDIAVSNYVAWACKQQWFKGISIAAPKLLLGDETSLKTDELEDAKAEVKNAKGDVEWQIQQHFSRVMKAIRAGGTIFTETTIPNPAAANGPNRLAGI